MIVGIYWSRIVGPVVGLAALLILFRIGGTRGLLLGLAAFVAACWWGETHWARRAPPEEKRLALEDRVRKPSE